MKTNFGYCIGGHWGGRGLDRGCPWTDLDWLPSDPRRLVPSAGHSDSAPRVFLRQLSVASVGFLCSAGGSKEARDQVVGAASENSGCVLSNSKQTCGGG